MPDTQPVVSPQAAPPPFPREAPGEAELIVRADKRGMILFVSPACAVMGYEPGDLVGRSSLEFVHPEDLGRFVQNSASLYQPEATVDPDRRVLRFRRQDGSWIWLKGEPKVQTTHDGRLGDVVNIFTPVSEEAALEMLSRAARAQRLRPG